ncbi:MAG: hypothetical protein KJ558_16775 [Gammaproteobacteria bacterium]|nr:hypothetical protein [Gammaproteobacteria bacterium]MBU1656447.1 hypothetical protein [Gammaproteobacteria bacterium]MBU1961471.1 hypothetical protein [Gammaproteobacteria bacterium]
MTPAFPLMAQVQQIFKLGEGEYSMFLPDIPTQQIDPPVIYLAANSSAAHQQGGDLIHKMGVCWVINSDADISPTSDATTYSRELGKLNIDFGFYPDGTTR